MLSLHLNARFVLCREHHKAHAYARTALHWHAICIIFFVLCAIVYYFIGFDTCETRYLHWLGLLPMVRKALVWLCPVSGSTARLFDALL